MNLLIGEDERSMLLPFNQTLKYTWSNKYCSFNDSTYEVIGDTSIEINGKIKEGKDIKEKVSFAMFGPVIHSSLLLKVIMINSDTGRDDGQFGFAYGFDDYSYSIIHQLKERNLIEHFAYSISTPDSFNGGFIFFGGLPRSNATYVKNGSCEVESTDNSNHLWGCRLNKIVFFEKEVITYNNLNVSYFQAAEEFIFVPHHFFQFLLDKVFSLYLDENLCKLVKDYKVTVILCNDQVIKTMPTCSFVFGNYSLTWKMDFLFSKQNKNPEVLRTFHMQSLHSNEGEWIFGMSFIRQYEMLFDYENKAITFFANEGIEEIYSDESLPYFKHKNINTCFIFIIFLSLIGISNIVISRSKRIR